MPEWLPLTSEPELMALLKPQDDILVCETKDLVKIGIRADVFFRGADPMKAILQVGRDKIDSLVMETSIATLTNILRSTPQATLTLMAYEYFQRGLDRRSSA